MTINLIDSNDHIPEFPQSTYSLSVMENSPSGTIIAPNITVRHRSGGGHTSYQALGTPSTSNSACPEGTDIFIHTGRT